MSMIKYATLLAVAAMCVSVVSVMSVKPPDMPPVDGNTWVPPQYSTPPNIDGFVKIADTWPLLAFIDFMYITGKPQSTKVAEVYMMFDDLSGYTQPRKDDPPAGYGPEDEQGYYFYIGIKPLPGYSIPTGDPGAWVRIDWNQDGYIDFRDNNGNSATTGGPWGGYSTQFASTAEGAEWAIPYIDEYNGVCKSPFDIFVHIDVIQPLGGKETSTFPDRPPGPFYSTTICVGDLVKPEPPPEPGEWGIRTIGFWKHQFRTALDINKGHQHIDDETLESYITYISTNSQITELQDMDTDMWAALALLELRGKHPMYDRAVQQLLAVWLNYVSGNEYADLDGDGVFETSLLQVIHDTEAALLDGDPTNDEYYKDLCDAVNNSGPD